MNNLYYVKDACSQKHIRGLYIASVMLNTDPRWFGARLSQPGARCRI